MVDFVTAEKRSRIMRGVRSKDTRPEKFVRCLLHKHGYRFRLHNQKLPGKPDITLPRYRAALLVHGCFWHNHEGCPGGRLPSSNTCYWNEKISRTKARDEKHAKALAQLGWRVLVLWECELDDEAGLWPRIESFLQAQVGQLSAPSAS
jgi:DNA mismatch endonuclease (patch repair protein)